MDRLLEGGEAMKLATQDTARQGGREESVELAGLKDLGRMAQGWFGCRSCRERRLKSEADDK